MIETISAPWLSSGAYEQRVPVNRMSEPGLDLAACVERVRQRDEDAARWLLEHLYPLVLKAGAGAPAETHGGGRFDTDGICESVCEN